MASTHSDANTDVLAPPADGSQNGGAMIVPEMAQPLPSGYGMGPSPAAELLYGGFNQTWLVNCLRRRWLMAALLGLLIGSLVGGLLYVLFPASSRTTAYLMMNFNEDSALGGKETRLTAKQIEQEQFSQMTLIKSSQVLGAAMTSNDVHGLQAVTDNKPDPTQWMLEDLVVSFPNEGNVMEVRYDGDESPEEMVIIINAIIDAYLKDVVYSKHIEQTQIVDDLEQVKKELSSNLAKKMDELKRKIDLAEGADSDTAEIETKQLMDNIHFLKAELAKVEKELLNNDVMKELAIAQANSPTKIEIAVAEAIDRDPMMANYRQQIFELDSAIMQRQAMEQRQGSPAVLRLQQSKAQVESMMRKYEAKAERELREKIAQIPNEGLQAALAQWRVVKEKLEAQKEAYESELKTSEEDLLRLGASDPAIALLRNEIEYDQEVVRDLKLRLQALAIEQKARGYAGDKGGRHDKVRVMQPAAAREKINTVERVSIAGVGGLAALALTCYGVALVEFRKRRLNGPTDVDEGLGIRVLGVLPATTARRSLAGGSLVAAQVSEAMDSVRATLMHASTKMRRQVVMVTASESMEGTTTVAANLALSLARAGRRTLLIDGDLRSPSLHALFGMNLDGGFCEVLRSELDVTDAVQTTQTENLWLMTAGVCDRAAVQYLATDQIEPIFGQLRTQFDFIIIDAAPVLKIADGLALGQLVDGAILTVLRDHSEVRKINKAAELLDNLGVRIIGSVVNGVPVRADRRVARLQAGASQRQLPGKAAKPSKSKPQKPVKKAAAEPASTAVAEEPTAEPPRPAVSDIDIDDFEIDLDD